jgi:hypothetical protein
MAMVCAAMGCPPLRYEPYRGDKLDEQLDDQTRRFLGDSAKFKIDRKRKMLALSPIFDWFGGDFVNKYGGEQTIGRHGRKKSAVLNFVARYLSEAQRDYVLTGSFRIRYAKYDWTLNEQKAREQKR